MTRLYGLEEAERQLAVAMRIYASAKRDRPWSDLSLTERRPFINAACNPPYVDDMVSE